MNQLGSKAFGERNQGERRNEGHKVVKAANLPVEQTCISKTFR
jgi:hypothetical protein